MNFPRFIVMIWYFDEISTRSVEFLEEARWRGVEFGKDEVAMITPV